MYEDADSNIVTATFELPGLSKDKVSIDVKNGNLTVSGEVSGSTERSEHGYSVRERRTGRFTRSVKLPDGTQVGDSLFRGELWIYGYCLASGHQSRDGKRGLDGHVPQELPGPRAPAHRYRLNSDLDKTLA